MKYFAFLFLFLAACQLTQKSADRDPAGSNEGRSLPIHLIVTVHGIGGNDKTFGKFSEIAKVHLSQINPTYNYQFINVKYSTGIDEKGTYDFAQQLGGKIDEFFKTVGGIKEKDIISLVAHSQGGLVSSIWYFQSLITNPEAGSDPALSKFTKYATHMDSFITLGTPFWGSKMAATAQIKGLNYVAGKTSFGEKELQEMAFSSNTIFKFRRRAIGLDKMDPKAIPYKLRTLGIAGVMPKTSNPQFENFTSEKSKDEYLILAKVMGTYGFGGDRYESDLAVILPSARFDFIYGEALNSGYKANENLPFTEFKTTDYYGTGTQPLFIMDTVHASGDAHLYDLVEIPGSCLDTTTCKHPTYRYLLMHLANCRSEVNNCNGEAIQKIIFPMFTPKSYENYLNVGIEEEMRGFALDINIRVPLEYDIPDENLDRTEGVFKTCQFEFRDSSNYITKYINMLYREDHKLKVINNDEPPYKIMIGRSREWLSRSITPPYNNKRFDDRGEMVEEPFELNGKKYKMLRYHLTGVAMPTNPSPDNVDVYKRIRASGGFPVVFKVSLPGLKPRIISAKVQPTFSTYVDIQLEK